MRTILVRHNQLTQPVEVPTQAPKQNLDSRSADTDYDYDFAFRLDIEFSNPKPSDWLSPSPEARRQHLINQYYGRPNYVVGDENEI